MPGILHTAPRVAKRYLQRRATFIGSMISVATPNPCVVLTYDDGPEPGGTDRVLTALANHGATATFFVLLTRVRRYPSLLAEVQAAGHEIALHGLDHRRLTGFSYREVKQRTMDGRAELEDATGQQIDWMRPPYGRQTLRSWRAVLAAGVTPVMWGPTTSDSVDIDLAQRVGKATDGAAAGSILLAHDGFAGPDDGVDDGPPPRLDRGELTDRVLETFGARGLRGQSLSAALSDGHPVLSAWFQR